MPTRSQTSLGMGNGVETGGGEWDDFLLHLELWDFFGLKAASSDLSWSQKIGVLEGSPPPFPEPGMVDILVNLVPGQFT